MKKRKAHDDKPTTGFRLTHRWATTTKARALERPLVCNAIGIIAQDKLSNAIDRAIARATRRERMIGVILSRRCNVLLRKLVAAKKQRRTRRTTR